MTNEIEQKFFDAFGIKPEHYEYCYHECRIPELANIPCDKKDCPHYSIEIYYPEITGRILLELIVLNNHNAPAVGDTLEELKNQVLYWCIQYKCKIYNQVRELFGINSAQVGQLK